MTAGLKSSLPSGGEDQGKESTGQQGGHCRQAQSREQRAHAGLGSTCVLQEHKGTDGALCAEEVACSRQEGAWENMDSFVCHSHVLGEVSAGEPSACH